MRPIAFLMPLSQEALWLVAPARMISSMIRVSRGFPEYEKLGPRALKHQDLKLAIEQSCSARL